MFKAKAKSVSSYLATLTPDRRSMLGKLRSLIKKHLPKGYKESFNWGAIVYEVPLSVYPTTYNGQPLTYAALAATKAGCSVHLMCAYGNAKNIQVLVAGFKRAGKRLNMGKACIRFRTIDDLDLGSIATVVASTPLAKYVGFAESVRTRKAGAKKKA
jgi:hypothetical protein